MRREKPQQNQIIEKGKKFELYKIKALLKKNYYVGARDYLYGYYAKLKFTF